MKTEVSPSHANVLGVKIGALNMESAIQQLATSLEERRKGYVCLVGVHGVMEAQRDPQLASIYAGAALTIPDGMPTVWVGRWQGHAQMERVPGPDLMFEILRRKELAGYTHFLYGGKDGVAEELRAKIAEQFPWVQIVGTHTPPFRDLLPHEEEALAEQVRSCRPDIVWVGISTPKQERFMRKYLLRLDTTLMFGVGAAFDFHTGRIHDCAEWIKLAGLQWLHRLMQDPKHLWRRYLRNNPAFVWHIVLQLTGWRMYPSARPASLGGAHANVPAPILTEASQRSQS